jgi:NAD(P)-dependent dehydrogenase (short-subunit alcohol dehydrogenase family)
MKSWRFIFITLPLTVSHVAPSGVMACPFKLTSDGHEMHFGTNHLGHFLLVKELLPVLKDTGAKAGSNSRVVVLSSAAHFNTYKKQQGGPIRFDKIDSPEGYDLWGAYVSVLKGGGGCQSWTCQGRPSPAYIKELD